MLPVITHGIGGLSSFTCALLFLLQINLPPISGKSVYTSAQSQTAPNHKQNATHSATKLIDKAHMPRYAIRYVIAQRQTCADDVFLLIAVTSALRNFQQREAIRKTWGSLNGARNVKLIFVLGVSASENVTDQRDVAQESNTYRDIVQTDTIDSYANLTYKSIAILKWADTYCPRARYVLKTDDDMFVNVPLLVEDLKSSELSRFVMGNIIAAAQPMRDPDSKWYTSVDAYPQRMYPTYISGTAYVISGDLIHDLYSATRSTDLFWLEDVFVTGMAITKTDANHVFNGKFGFQRRPMKPCLFRIVITAHELTSTELTNIWKDMNDPSLNCDYTHIHVNDLY